MAPHCVCTHVHYDHHCTFQLNGERATLMRLAVQDLIVEIWRGYHAFSVKGKMLPNPSLFYADPATPESLVKNALNIIVALISDAIIVSCITLGRRGSC